MASAPTRPAPPPRAPQARPERRSLSFEEPAANVGHRIVLYGPGGVGKTTLADLAPGPVVSFDLDESLAILRPEHTQRIAGIENWDNLRATLNGDGWDGVRTLVIDSATRAEELAVAWTIANVPHEKGHRVSRLEDYGYGKGYQIVYEVFLTLLGDLDRHVRAGRNAILICHDCTTNTPNPQGDDWLRYEPRLMSPSSGKASVRLRVREWADHLLFLGYDIDVKDGKGRGCGTRTLWPVEMPHCMAKSRRLSDPIPLRPNDTAVWDALFGKPNPKKEEGTNARES
ncbi:MAG TPA: ATP-binding protein [Planctomycetota bacterium]|nr:ATP-binding protein [Planctomycetota bacterium]HRR82270.1 ATP-binding protein [Planctomycetota bacterium]HRT97637.1 ATP-binding protein [Planctomycetota bacterium]